MPPKPTFRAVNGQVQRGLPASPGRGAAKLRPLGPAVKGAVREDRGRGDGLRTWGRPAGLAPLPEPSAGVLAGNLMAQAPTELRDRRELAVRSHMESEN